MSNGNGLNKNPNPFFEMKDQFIINDGENILKDMIEWEIITHSNFQ